jgi:glycosyltransferase involved in cell wall biosynthesis
MNMRALVIATSAKPSNMEQEISLGQRPRLDYLELCNRLAAPYMDYDPPWLHHHKSVRRLEEKLRLDIYWAKQIARKVKEQQYDVVLSMSERVGIPLAYMLSRQVKHVVILHHPMSPNKLRLIKALRVPHRWDMMLPLSQAEAKALRKTLHLGPDRIKVLHGAIDTEFYKSLNGSDLTSEQDYILSLGLSNRDYPTLIRALHKLPHVTCQISATSAWASHKTGYENETIPGNVHIKSYDHPSIIRDAYAKSRFVVIPIRLQISQWSAGSVSVLQPQAMGKPVIATRTPGLSDYVLDGETGILVEGGNPAAMAEAINYLWSNPEKAAAMGRRAREWVRADFSLDKWLDDVSHLLAV